MAINSKRKGSAGERELCGELRKFGFQARRSQQFSGANGDEDVTHTVPGLHIECKRVERLNVLTAFKQAKRDAKPGKIPVVMHRCNRSEWLVSLSLDDFLALIKADDAIA